MDHARLVTGAALEAHLWEAGLRYAKSFMGQELEVDLVAAGRRPLSELGNHRADPLNQSAHQIRPLLLGHSRLMAAAFGDAALLLLTFPDLPQAALKPVACHLG